MVSVYQTTRLYIPKDSTLHGHSCENLKSHIYIGISRNDIQRIKIVLGNKSTEQETELNYLEYLTSDLRRNMETKFQSCKEIKITTRNYSTSIPSKK
jgi:hypothetical protein